MRPLLALLVVSLVGLSLFSGRTALAISDRRDSAAVFSALNDLMQFAAPGRSLEWRNPKTGNSGRIEAIQPHSSGGETCWTYTRTYEEQGASLAVDGTACEIAPGLWEIRSEKPPRTTKPAGRKVQEAKKQTYDASIVRGTQELLASLGYDPGPVDGAYGNRTKNAILAYQSDRGLERNGIPSDELLAHLKRHHALYRDQSAPRAAQSQTAVAGPSRKYESSSGASKRKLADPRLRQSRDLDYEGKSARFPTVIGGPGQAVTVKLYQYDTGGPCYKRNERATAWVFSRDPQIFDPDQPENPKLQSLIKSIGEEADKRCPGVSDVGMVGIENNVAVYRTTLLAVDTSAQWVTMFPKYPLTEVEEERAAWDVGDAPIDNPLVALVALGGLLCKAGCATGDAIEQSRVDDSGVTYKGGVPDNAEQVVLCNKQGKKKRLSSLIHYCPGERLVNTGKKCEWIQSGWSYFEAEQCKVLRTGAGREALLAIEEANDDGWSPVLYADQRRLDDVPEKAAGALQPISEIVFCAERADNYKFTGDSPPPLYEIKESESWDSAIPKAIEDLKCVERRLSFSFYNVFVRGKASTDYEFRF